MVLPPVSLLSRARGVFVPRSAFRRALAEGDVAMLWRLWGKLNPGAYQPANWQEAEIQLHLARAAADSVAIRLRCYSHHWLKERGLASPLPEALKPDAERFQPKVASAVGFAWTSTSEYLRAARPAVMAAVGQRIEEMAADGMLETQPDKVRAEMMLTKNRVLHKLFGNPAALKKGT